MTYELGDRVSCAYFQHFASRRLLKLADGVPLGRLHMQTAWDVDRPLSLGWSRLMIMS